MAHNHGNEYQVKIVHEDGTEELSGWVNSEEQHPQIDEKREAGCSKALSLP